MRQARRGAEGPGGGAGRRGAAALGGFPEAMAGAMGIPDEFFAARDEILRTAAGGAFFAVAMSERGAGSRLSKLSTVYSREDGGYHIKGSKSFVSGSGQADAYLV